MAAHQKKAASLIKGSSGEQGGCPEKVTQQKTQRGYNHSAGEAEEGGLQDSVLSLTISDCFFFLNKV